MRRAAHQVMPIVIATICYLVTFAVVGAWHGLTAAFVLWGLYHGAFLVIERVGLAAAMDRVPLPLRHGYALLVVVIGWVFFRADTLGGAVAMLGAMAGAGAMAPASYAPSWFWNAEVLLAFAAGVIGSAPIAPALGRRLALHGPRDAGPGQAGAAEGGLHVGLAPSLAVAAGLAALLVASVMLSASRTYNPFIYFRF